LMSLDCHSPKGIKLFKVFPLTVLRYSEHTSVSSLPGNRCMNLLGFL
jgi:hypothetical protein